VNEQFGLLSSILVAYDPIMHPDNNIVIATIATNSENLWTFRGDFNLSFGFMLSA